MIKALLGTFATALLSAVFVFAVTSLAAVNTTQVAVHSYSSGNVSTSSYTTLVASAPISASKLEVCDTSGKLLKLAFGAAGSETDVATVAASSCIIVPYYVPAGTRVSIEAIDAAATTGYNLLSFIP